MKLSQPVKELGVFSSRCRVWNPFHWKQNTLRQQSYQAHKDTETIFLRFGDIANDINHIINYPLYNHYSRTINSYLQELKQHYTIVDYTVIIANLKKGGIITPHVDKAEFFDSCHRVHIPIRTNPKCIFQIGHQTLHMKQHHGYEISNTNCKHSVINKGNQDRYHLIFDISSKSIL